MIAPGPIKAGLQRWLGGAHVVYHHLPKSGGTSIKRALRWAYPLSFTHFGAVPAFRAMETMFPGRDERFLIQQIRDFREKQLLTFLFQDIRCIAGHVAFSTKAHDAFHHRYRFVTTLREPVTSLLSAYYYDQRDPNDRGCQALDLEAYLETPRAAEFASSYATFYDGLPVDREQPTSVSVEAAKANLRKFSLVGLVENMPSFERRLRELLGVRLRIGRHNAAEVETSERLRSLAPALRRRLEEMSAVNIEVYEFVRRELQA